MTRRQQIRLNPFQRRGVKKSERWTWSLKGEGGARGDLFLEREAVMRSLSALVADEFS